MNTPPPPVALITGGSRGIGLATARAFLEHGYRVAICARRRETLDAAERRLAGLGDLLAVAADVSMAEQAQGLVEAVLSGFGTVDVLVNNAGIAWVGEFARQDYASMGAVIDVNIKGVLYMARAVLPVMQARRSGVIINVSSGAGLAGFRDLVSYCTSKFGVVGFTESLDAEVRECGIRVYGLCPGRVATDMQVQYAGARIGMAPEAVAKRLLALAGPKPRAKTGTCVTL